MLKEQSLKANSQRQRAYEQNKIAKGQAKKAKKLTEHCQKAKSQRQNKQKVMSEGKKPKRHKAKKQ